MWLSYSSFDTVGGIFFLLTRRWASETSGGGSSLKAGSSCSGPSDPSAGSPSTTPRSCSGAASPSASSRKTEAGTDFLAARVAATTEGSSPLALLPLLTGSQ